MLRTALQLLPFMLWSSVTALGAERSSRPTDHLLFALGLMAVIVVTPSKNGGIELRATRKEKEL
jgi:hypothetical protein